MVVIKEVKLVSNWSRKNVVVEYLETIPTEENPIIYEAQRVSKLPYEQALQLIGTQLTGVIIYVRCQNYQYLPKGRKDRHDHSCSDWRWLYVEQGDNITDVPGPMLSDEEIGELSNTTWDWM